MMTTSSPSKYDDFASKLITWLVSNPDSTLYQIQQVLNDYADSMPHPPKKVPDAYSVIYYIRGVLGPETIVCDRRRHLSTYSVADSRADALEWATERRINIRNQIHRTIKAVEDIQTKFGSDHDTRMVEASLRSAFMVIDASLT